MKPENYNGYLLQLAYALGSAYLIEFFAETGGFFYILLACLALLVAYLVFQAYLQTGENKYAPILQEKETEIEEHKDKYGKLEFEFSEHLQWAEAEMQKKAESIASLLRNAELWQNEKSFFERKLKDLESGKALNDAQWEVTRLGQELTQQKESYERQVTQAQEKLTQADKVSEGKLLELHNKLTQAQKDSQALQKEVTRLLPYETQAKELFKESEGRRLKQSFAQVLNGSGNDKILEVSKSLEELGISPMELCTTLEKKKRYQEALNAQAVFV